MRLKVEQPAAKAHSELVAAVCWSGFNEIYSCSDDGTIQKWSGHGESQGKVCVMEAYYTDMCCFSAGARKQTASSNDAFVVGCTDGTFKVVSRTGKLEKTVEAHRGAVLAVKWSPDGSAVASAGEDGQVKLWSRSGMLRSTLAQADSPVYGAAWGPDGDQLLFSSGQHLTVRSVNSSTKLISWKAHDNVVTKVDWSTVNGQIVSGGEDCYYKVWDSYGRLLYQSRPLEYPITSLAWAPGGDTFVVGSFNLVSLCDRMGWSYCKARTQTGSLLSLSWSPDGTRLAGGGGNGSVCFAQLLDMHLEDGRVHASLDSSHHVVVVDILSETREQLDFREAVMKMSLGYNHLVVTTATQCHVYSTTNWNTPHIFDLKEPPLLLLQCERTFLILDPASGLQVCTYEGRHVCSPKPQGLRCELLSKAMLSLSSDTLAVMEGPSSGTVRFFETAQGKPLGEAYTHGTAIVQVALNQSGTAPERLLAIVDRQRELHLLHVTKRRCVKLAANVECCCWHDTAPLLAAIVDGVLTVWYWPEVVWVDPELLQATCLEKRECDFGSGAQVQGFYGSKLLVRRRDGSQGAASIAPYPLIIHALAKRALWDKAARLCGFIQDPATWALLAGLAMAANELSTAEYAFGALDAVDRLQYVLHTKGLVSEEVRAAELAVYRRQPEQAEAMLLQAGLVYQAIKMRIRMHQWVQAMELARKHKQHIDTVLMHRQRYLTSAGQQESLPTFMELAADVPIDEVAIKHRIRQDKAKAPLRSTGQAAAAAARQNRPR